MIRSDAHSIAVVAALRTEIGPLLRALSCRRVGEYDGLIEYVGTAGDREIRFVETGIGPERAEKGVTRVLRHCSPRLLISVGFSGGLTEGLTPGDAVYGIRSVQYDTGTNRLGRPSALKSRTDETALPSRVHPGTIVTSNAPPVKRELAKLLPAEWNPAVVDMETAHLARIAEASATPFIYIRSVCDELGMEPDLSIERLTDERGRVRLSKVFRYALFEPAVILRLAALARRAGIASKSIERIVIRILETDW